MAGVAQDTPAKLNVAHILIQHADSERGTKDITRTKVEALKLAMEVADMARPENADFGVLAKEYSDGPSAANGGDLGNFKPKDMVKSFSTATIKLKIGETSDPVESRFGYHVILRKSLVEDLSAAHILIQFSGSARAKPSINRSKAEALVLATDITKQARTKGADFAALTANYSDGQSGPKRGDLGTFTPQQMVREFSQATSSLKIGAVSDPVETQFGYYVILRKALPQTISASRILVQYRGSERADESIMRTKEQAQARIAECIKRLEAGEKFEDLTREYSDGPSRLNGGELGEFQEGVTHPIFNDAAFALEKGALSDVVETPFGFHVIYRYK